MKNIFFLMNVWSKNLPIPLDFQEFLEANQVFLQMSCSGDKTNKQKYSFYVFFLLPE